MTDDTAVPPAAAQSEYTMGYSEGFLKVLKRRNAQDCAAHLLERLRPGMRVLDFGCGPGTISVGLAEAVAPNGRLDGIDMEQTQVEMASREAGRSGVPAEFRVGDVMDLPFEDNTFDAAHCHAVLMHVPDTAGALAEIKRVLKPDGILAAREGVISSSFFEPHFGSLQKAWSVFGNIMAANGGYPDCGKELPVAIATAGFEIQEVICAFEMFIGPEDKLFWAGFVRSWFFGDSVVSAAGAHGLASQDDFDRWEQDLEQWLQEPSGWSGLAWGHTVATNGGS